MAMEYFPAFIELADRPVLVVGGGEVAARKVRLLRRASARITVVAPSLDVELAELAALEQIDHRATVFSADDLDGVWLAVAATDSADVNAAVRAAGDARQVFVNAVDDPDSCSFITPAIVDRSPILIAISSAGAAPVLARQLRERLEAILPKRLGALAALARRWRERVKSKLDGLTARRRFWESFFTGEVADHALAGRTDFADRATGQLLAQQGHGGQRQGEAWLIGAGPGDSGLLTLRALQLMQQADVVLYDRLVSGEILDLARRDAELISVGKTPGGHQVRQEQINQLLITHAKAGKRVARLKGGDPFVFGRGGEEMLALRDAGVNFQVVPGVTAAVGCGAYAGIPLTHRDHAHSVQFVTAHCQNSLDCLDWSQLAGNDKTLVFYMGVRHLATIQQQLTQHGVEINTPVALVENGTRDEQRVVTGVLGRLAATAEQHEVKAPAVLIVGTVVLEATAWFEKQPAIAAPLTASAG